MCRAHGIGYDVKVHSCQSLGYVSLDRKKPVYDFVRYVYNKEDKIRKKGEYVHVYCTGSLSFFYLWRHEGCISFAVFYSDDTR